MLYNQPLLGKRKGESYQNYYSSPAEKVASDVSFISWFLPFYREDIALFEGMTTHCTNVCVCVSVVGGGGVRVHIFVGVCVSLD